MNPRPSLVQRLGLLAAALCPALAFAQAPVALSERDYFEELPVVLSVSRLAQPMQDAPGAVTVIDREMIRRSGARQVVDLLRLVPGFQVSSVPNAPPVAVYHGLAQSYPRHMQVLLDGRSQYSPFFNGGVNWNLLPVSLDDIERIEVTRGSDSAAYGSNAFLGVVNIVTRHAADTRGAAAEVRSGTGAIGDRRLRVGTGDEDLSLRLTAENQKDDGLDGFRDGVQKRLVAFRADWRLGLRDELQIQAGEITALAEMGRGTATDQLRVQDHSQRFLSIGWRHVLAEGEDLAVRYYRTEERGVESFSFTSPPYTVLVDYGFQSIRNNLEAVHTFSPTSATRLVWGGEVRTDSVTGFQYYGRRDPVALGVGRVFGNLEWRFAPEWVANAGATWEYDSNSKTTFSPRLALNWHLLPHQTIRVGVARAYRTPSMFETRSNYAMVSTTGVVLQQYILSRGKVSPESITSRELGWLGEFPRLRLTGDVRIFEERIDDRILRIRPAVGMADDWYNAQDIRTRGFEQQFRWRPFDETRVILGQAFIRMFATARPPAEVASYDPTGDTLQASSSAPTHTTTLMLMQRLPGGFDVSATYHAVGAMKWGNNTYSPSYRRLDWRLAYAFQLGPQRGELAFTVLADGSPYAEHNVQTDIVKRRGYFSLRLEY